MASNKQREFVKGTTPHRRTESDYLGVLLDAVTLDEWREVVNGALQAAKEGDATARAWLTQYLIGKPGANTPTPLNVVVQQWSGSDPVASRLAQPIIDREMFPSFQTNDEWEDKIRAMVAAELEQKQAIPKAREIPVKVAAPKDSAE